MKLDIGCGASKRPGYIGMDKLHLPDVDIIHDLDIFPYPFANDEIEEVWMDQVLEHMKEPMRVMEEIYRICRNGAKVTIGVPYFRSFYAFIDPTHKTFFGTNWFYYFDPEHQFCKKYRYTNAKFRVDRIEFDREFKKNRIRFFHRIMIGIAERNMQFYEAKLSHLCPLNSLTFYLTVVK